MNPLPILSDFQQLLKPAYGALNNTLHRPCLISTQSSAISLALTILFGFTEQSAAIPWSNDGKSPKKENTHSDGSSWLIVRPSEEEAEGFYQDLLFFSSMLGLPMEPLVHFPQWASIPYQSSFPASDVRVNRVRTLHRLIRKKRTVVVVSIQAMLHKLLPPSAFADACLAIRPGDTFERESLTASLLRLGYQRVSMVEIPGEFSMRGGIVDIFSTANSNPLRVEFLGDTVESVRTFDPTTQESTQKSSQAWVLPVREFLPQSHDSSPFPLDLPSNAEWYNPQNYPTMCTLGDYFHSPPQVVLHSPSSLEKEAATFWNQVLEVWDQQRTLSINPEKGPFPEPDRLYLLWEDVVKQLQQWPTIGSDTLAPLREDLWDPIIPLPAQTAASAGLGLKGTPFGETLSKLDQLRNHSAVHLVARSHGQVERLHGLLSEHEYPAVPWESSLSRLPADQRHPFYCLQGELSSGWISHEARLAFITEEELFGKGIRHRPQQKTRTAKFLSSLDDLKEGDLVVHVHHGISKYQGLRRLSVHGFESDYLLLKFAGTDTLYVPLDRLNDIQQYRGADQHLPKLDRLGGSSWARTKAKVKKGIEDMAEELVSLYANREVVRRKAYAHDTTIIHEFEAGFEYEETQDQLKAIEDIHRDMDSPKPMDRLVCGDVGYGKTEVAMRAALKAVQDNRQVAVLVPTTLLAQQHSETFSLRFAPFPVRVSMLSRFQSSAECKTILRDVAAGTVDIVIGTHRLLQKDVQFKNLGLVITDEEQWFGVRHKERLKQLRTQVDVLTLTATPIPRTLQMAFSGVRDLSVIETPPPGRLAIQTQVLRFDPIVIREAINRELARGGQVFYVHNRVQTMERTGAWLQGLIPNARVIIAHGQMDERLLEKTMLQFFHQEAEILVASAIIQSGLDIPNANTILIDRADLFGLAQLYQLRGRVGRGGQQAYAYCFIPNEETLSTDAQKRLTAIQEFADLGSGFRIAAADLEIRGAGNLLGKQQSGNITAVGLDLYLQMVEHAVQQLKGIEVKDECEPTLHLNVSAYIPEDYVEDAHQRLNLYKRLSSSEQIGDLALLHGETQDRYGPLPDPVERLYEVMQVKLLAKALSLESVEARGNSVAIAFHEKAKLPEDGIQWLLEQYEGRIHFISPRSFEIESPQDTWKSLYGEINTILQGLKQRNVAVTNSA